MSAAETTDILFCASYGIAEVRSGRNKIEEMYHLLMCSIFQVWTVRRNIEIVILVF